MTQDEFQPNAHQPPVQTEQLSRQTQTEQSSRQVPKLASMPDAVRQPTQRAASGRRPLFRS